MVEQVNVSTSRSYSWLLDHYENLAQGLDPLLNHLILYLWLQISGPQNQVDQLKIWAHFLSPIPSWFALSGLPVDLVLFFCIKPGT